jgi:hypothetical protein
VIDWTRLTAKVKQFQDSPEAPTLVAVVIHADEPLPVRPPGEGHNTIHGALIIHATKVGGHPVKPDHAVLLYEHGGTVEDVRATNN